MTAKEMDNIVKEMRNHGAKIDTRTDLENYVYRLKTGLEVIGRSNLVNELNNLYNEMENVDTNELVRIGTFKN